MSSGGDYMAPSPSPGTVSGGDGEETETVGGNVSPAPGGAPGGDSETVSGGDPFPGVLSMLPGMDGSGEESALYAGTETVSGNGADIVDAMEQGFTAVVLLLGLIAGILLMNGFFVWKARD